VQASIPSRVKPLLEWLGGIRGIERFRLVGGTALAIQCGHRVSVDIDLATADDHLPRQWLRRLVVALETDGKDIRDVTPVSAQQDFEDAGLDVYDYHQDWLVNGVKLTLFTLDPEAGREALRGNAGVPAAGRLSKISSWQQTMFLHFLCRQNHP
jgi:hypothetical protein